MGLFAAVLLSAPDEPAPVVSRPHVESVFHDRHVQVTGRGGYIAQAVLTQSPRTSGRSPDVIRVFFDQPVELLGIGVSVDIGNLALTEVSVGVGWEEYEMNASGAVLHTSHIGVGQIDEQVWFEGAPLPVRQGEWVAVTAWLQNRTEALKGVSPEVVLWYQAS